MRKAKILATLGPASSPPDKLSALMNAGVNAIRINCSHASLDELSRDIQLIRKTAKAQKRNIAIVLDLQGPRIRTGRLVNGGPVELKVGSKVSVSIYDRPGDAECIVTNYRDLPNVVKKGSRILLDDGTIELTVLKSTRHEVECEVTVGGRLKEHKGLNIPGAPIDLPTLTAKDRRDLEWGLTLGVDFVALSFVRSQEDVLAARARIKERQSHAAVIAKIERPEAVERLDGILEAADGIMVARGDLAVELSPSEVPVVQKKLVHRANSRGKMAIVATQMLESMITHAQPTRAEASDVANAIFDGADAVMLSGETAVGVHPDLAVSTMARIIRTAEGSEFCSQATPASSAAGGADFSHALARAVRAAAVESRAKAVVVFTMTGHSARILAKHRPPVPIYAMTPSEQVQHQLGLCHNIVSLHCPLSKDTDRMIQTGQRILMKESQLKKGDIILAMAGGTAKHRASNMLKIQRLGEL